MHITSKFYTVNNTKVHVAAAGKGKPLVLVHGWSNNWIGWTLLAQQLAPHYKLYMLDLPGFGDSGTLPHYSLTAEAEIVAQFIKENVKNPEAIIGASMGSLIVAHMDELHPALTKKIILIGAVFHRSSIRKITRFARRIIAFSTHNGYTQPLIEKTIRSALTAYFVEKMLNAYRFNKTLVDKYNIPGRQKITAKSYLQLGESAVHFSLEQYVGQTNKHLLFIYGRSEKYTDLHWFEEFMKKQDNEKTAYYILSECGHNPGYEKPQETGELIMKFLTD
ncbi:alpha/beta hydrolase [Candidatus Parcubacteria bacterium]|nr:MAG: alpha/beta hydrolase [Candidatus Parcubacteria bacterium]